METVWCMIGADLSLWRLYGAGRTNGDCMGTIQVEAICLMGAGASGGSIGVGMAMELVEATSCPYQLPFLVTPHRPPQKYV